MLMSSSDWVMLFFATSTSVACSSMVMICEVFSISRAINIVE